MKWHIFNVVAVSWQDQTQTKKFTVKAKNKQRAIKKAKRIAFDMKPKYRVASVY